MTSIIFQNLFPVDTHPFTQILKSNNVKIQTRTMRVLFFVSLVNSMQNEHKVAVFPKNYQILCFRRKWNANNLANEIKKATIRTFLLRYFLSMADDAEGAKRMFVCFYDRCLPACAQRTCNKMWFPLCPNPSKVFFNKKTTMWLSKYYFLSKHKVYTFCMTCASFWSSFQNTNDEDIAPKFRVGAKRFVWSSVKTTPAHPT